jgi:predicted anti-sigma-YlaC factor YlaD
MIEISCQVCLDLIPLVKDNVASEDSKKLVLEHIRQCEACKDEYRKWIWYPSGNG